MTDGSIFMRGGSVPQMYDVEASAVALTKTVKASHPHPIKVGYRCPDTSALIPFGMLFGVLVFMTGIMVFRGLENLVQWIDRKIRRVKERNEFTQIDRS